jgi:carbon monoxide dehydrogenase subunit G
MKFSNTVRIGRRPADVFAFLTRFENLPLWNYALEETRRVDTGPVGVGARYVQTRTIPRPAVETFEVTRFSPDHRVDIRGTLGPFRAEISYLLEADGEGTVVTNSMDLEPSGALHLVAPVARPGIRSAVAANLDVLKRLLEGADARSGGREP